MYSVRRFYDFDLLDFYGVNIKIKSISINHWERCYSVTEVTVGVKTFSVLAFIGVRTDRNRTSRRRRAVRTCCRVERGWENVPGPEPTTGPDAGGEKGDRQKKKRRFTSVLYAHTLQSVHRGWAPLVINENSKCTRTSCVSTHSRARVVCVRLFVNVSVVGRGGGGQVVASSHFWKFRRDRVRRAPFSPFTPTPLLPTQSFYRGTRTRERR